MAETNRIRAIKMNQFINYDVNTGLSINTFRKPGASVGDIGDLAKAYHNQDECVVCDLEGAKDTLEDGEYWSGTSVSAETLEMIHSFLADNE